MTTHYRLLIVDDEPGVLQALERELRSHQNAGEYRFHVETRSSPVAALACAGDFRFDLVLSDYRMPEMDGVAFLRAWRELQPGTVRMILSGQTDFGGLVDAINEAGISRFISKPWDRAELLFAIEQSLRERALLLENERLADELRTSRGLLSRQEVELRRLERECPGITRVNWGPDGSVLLDDEAWEE